MKTGKKYMAILIAFMLILICFTVLEIPQRIAYCRKEMGSYRIRDFYVEDVDIIVSPLIVDLSRYAGEKIMLYDDDNVKLYLDRIQYAGDHYLFTVISQGTSTYRHGEIIEAEAFRDVELSAVDKEHTYIFGLKSVGELKKEAKEIQFVLYAMDGYYNDLPYLSISIPMNGLFLRRYERR